MINMGRYEEIQCVAVRSLHGMTLVLDNDTTSALANLLADLDRLVGTTPPNYMEHLVKLRKEAFGY